MKVRLILGSENLADICFAFSFGRIQKNLPGRGCSVQPFHVLMVIILEQELLICGAFFHFWPNNSFLWESVLGAGGYLAISLTSLYPRCQ